MISLPVPGWPAEPGPGDVARLGPSAGDGVGRLWDDIDLWSCRFSVVDIETTGSVWGQDAITEIGMVDVSDGVIGKTWRSFVNPGRSIPRFITGLTGITDEMVAAAPRIDEILGQALDFIGDAIVVGHNVRFDAGFINFELRRHKQPPLGNPLIDTLALSRRTVAAVYNYKLGTLTRELGIDVERHHRALADAVATAQLLLHCVKKLEDCGVFTFGALGPFLQSRSTTLKRPARVKTFGGASQLPVWTAAMIDELATVPSVPGAYILKDAGQTVVYVGKSCNLRRRLRAYATARTPAGAKMRALRATVATFECIPTGSEFEALLLESELVKAYDPPFNDRLRNFKDFGFIKIERVPYGRVMTTTRLAADGAHYFGPYGSIAATRAAVSALQEALDLYGADGPSAGVDRLPAAQYDARIEEAIACIEGAVDDVLLTVAKRRDEAAVRGRTDVVRREELRLERLRRLRVRHAGLRLATGLHVLVLAPSSEPGEEACFLFCGGRLAGRCRLPRRLPQRAQASRLLAAMLAESHRPEQASRTFARQEEIDQLHILAGWFAHRREGLCYVELPPCRPTPDDAIGWSAAILDGRTIKLAEGNSPTLSVY